MALHVLLWQFDAYCEDTDSENDSCKLEGNQVADLFVCASPVSGVEDAYGVRAFEAVRRELEGGWQDAPMMMPNTNAQQASPI